MAEIHNPHDVFFKNTMSDKENAISFLQNNLPAELLRLIDLDSLQIEKDSFVSDKLQESFSDLLYQVQIAGTPGYIYLLFEHKSYPEKMIALQLLEYMVACWRLKARQKHPLPVIIPLVVYHGEKNWQVGLRLADLFAVTDQYLQKYLPDFSYLLYDLGYYRDEQIAGIPALKLALLLLKYIRSPQLRQKLVELLALLRDHPKWPEKLEVIIVYILYASDITPDELVSVTSEAISTQGGSFAMSTAQKLIEQGVQKNLQRVRKEGLQEGLQKGRKEGLQKGRKEGLLYALEIKFGTIEPEWRRVIDAIATDAELDKLGELIKQAGAADEFTRLLQQLRQ